MQSQVSSYSEIFDRIFICSHSTQLQRLEVVLPSYVGIIELTRAYRLRLVREAVSNKGRVDPSTIFHSLRRDEYLRIIRRQFGTAPRVGNAEVYRACLKLFATLAPRIAHDEMVRELRGRIRSELVAPLLSQVPGSLKGACLYAPLSLRQWSGLIQFLSQSPRTL